MQSFEYIGIREVKMQTSVTFTASTQTGNIPRISSAVKRLGYKSTNLRLERNSAQSLDIVTMIVEAQRTLLSDDFASIMSKMDNVLRVDVSHPSPTQATQPTAPAPSRHAAKETVVEALESADDDIAAFVKSEGRKLAGTYPDIRQPLIDLEASMDPTLRPILMKKMGYALGQWQYKKNFEQSGRINATVQRSLSMQKSHFNGMPVIQDLLSKGATRANENRNEDPMQQIEIVLSDFLNVSIDGATITVEDCPHCSTERSPAEPDCDFVKQFVQGFMLDNPAMKDKMIEQLSSRATGAAACIFEIM